MYCFRCGASMPNDSVFCPKCGTVVSNTPKHECKSCGAEMVMNDSCTEYNCLYCGAREIIIKHENAYAQAQQEIEISRMRDKAKQEDLQKKLNEAKKERDDHAYIDGSFFFMAVFFGIITALAMVIAFIFGNILDGFIALIQTVLCCVSLLSGMKKLGERLYWLHIPAVVVCMLLAPVWSSQIIPD